jgi:predicted dehydrogenase
VESLRAIVVGTGFGARVHVPALRGAGFTVEALVGQSPDKTRRRAVNVGVPRALTSLEEAFSLPDVQAVSVATPPSEHAPVVLAAVAARKHVICEKPFAMDEGEAERMLTRAEAAGVVHRVGHEFRFAPERALVARLVADGAIGEPRMATFVSNVSLVADPQARTPQWWFDATRGGGWLGASGSHAIDQIRFWLGEFEAVSATLSMVSPRPPGAEDSFGVLFRLQSGCVGVLQQSSGAWGSMSAAARIAGSRATLWIDGENVWLADARGERRVEIPTDLRLPQAPAPSEDPRHRFTHLEIAPYTRLAESFRDAILGRPASDGEPWPATFADGLACQRVLDAVRRSSQERRWVEIP